MTNPKLPDPADEPFLWVEHEVTGGGTWIPNNEGVLEQHEARGWRLTEPPAGAQTSRPGADGVPPGEWIELYHPETLGTQLAPADSGVVETFRLLGWVPKAEFDAEQEKEAAKAERKKSTPAGKSATDKE